MDNKRQKAIENEVSATRKGDYTNYLYVNTEILNDLGIEQYRSVDGDNFFCIIPPKNDDEFFMRKIWIHYNVGVDNTVYICEKKMYGKPCFECDKATKLMEKDSEDERLGELKPSLRYLAFVVDMASKKAMKKGVQWYDAPGMVKDGICSISQHKRTKEIIDVSDPEEDKSVCFTKSGKKLKTRYTAFELEKREYDFQEEWLDVPDFDSILKKVDYETVKADSVGFAPDEEKEEKPKERRSRREETEEQPKEREERKDRKDEKEEQPRERRSRDDDKEEPERSRRDSAEDKKDEGGSLRERLKKRLREEADKD